MRIWRRRVLVHWNSSYGSQEPKLWAQVPSLLFLLVLVLLLKYPLVMELVFRV